MIGVYVTVNFYLFSSVGECEVHATDDVLVVVANVKANRTPLARYERIHLSRSVLSVL